MSASANGHHEAGHASGGSHGSVKGYMVGFALSVLLTAVPFWLVMTHALSNKTAAALVITALAVVQIIVHMVYFLHMNTKSEGGWTMTALILDRKSVV